MGEIEDIFKKAMQGICYASHLTKNAPLITPFIKADFSSVSLYDIVIQMIFCHLFREDLLVDILSEEENNYLYKDTLNILMRADDSLSSEYLYISSFLAEHSLVLDNTMKSVIHSLEDALHDSNTLNDLNTSNETNTQKIILVLDPIDGTKGFISGRSYSIVVSCIQNRQVLFSIIASPSEGIVHYKCNMNLDGLSGYPHRKRVKTYSLLDTYHLSYKMFLDSLSLRICISAEESHSSPLLKAYLNEIGRTYDITVHRIDGQSKYAHVATQHMDVFIRVPNKKIEEKIWDHCAGVDMNSLSIVTDLYGNLLDPCTPPGYGVVASHSNIFHNLSIDIFTKLLIGE